MIDFVVAVKIDDNKRYELFDQTIVTLLKNTPKELLNKLIIINDNSSFYEFLDDINNSSFINDEKIIISTNNQQLGVGASKNIGVNLAQKYNKGRYLYLFDGDVYFTEKWSENLIQTFEKYKNEYKLLGCGIHPYLQARIDEGNNDITSHDAISGWSWFLDYEVWDKYGLLMDNSIGTGKSEDWEYCQRIRNDGLKVGCLKKQTIAHCGITNTEGNPIVGYEESLKLAKQIAPESIIL